MSDPNNAAVLDWRPAMTDELKADPIVAGWAEKATEKDVPSIIKSYAHLSKRMGSAVNIPGKDAKPEDVEAFKNRVYEAGVFRKPPGSPDEYKIAKPENLPAGISWNDELAKELATTLHKHGVPPDAVPDLLALQQKAMGGTLEGLKIDKDAAIAALKKEHGEQFDARMETASRMVKGLMAYDDAAQAFFDQTGLGNHPVLLNMLMKLAPMAMQDSAFLETLAVSERAATTPEQARDELAKIMTDTNHPMYKGYWSSPQDPEVARHVTAMFRKAHPEQA